MEKIIILGHENPDVDSIISGYILEKIMLKKGYFAEFVIPDEFIEDETLSICLRNGLNPKMFMKKIDLENKHNKYILVDHNERKLGGEIICIIDHHPTSKKINVKHYYNKKISSTAEYICMDNENLLQKFELKLAVLATLVDTASFHSSKSRDEDIRWVKDICLKYGFNYDNLYKEGLNLTSLENINKATIHGLKRYYLNNKHVESSYIQVENPKKEKEKILEIVNNLQIYLKNKGINAFVFIVFDMEKFETYYYLITKNNVLKKHLDYYASRGNDIIPQIEEYINKNQI